MIRLDLTFIKSHIPIKSSLILLISVLYRSIVAFQMQTVKLITYTVVYTVGQFGWLFNLKLMQCMFLPPPLSCMRLHSTCICQDTELNTSPCWGGVEYQSLCFMPSVQTLCWMLWSSATGGDRRDSRVKPQFRQLTVTSDQRIFLWTEGID